MSASSDSRASELAETTVLSRRTAPADMPRITVGIRWTIGLAGIVVLGWLFLARPPISLRYFWIYTAAFVFLQLVLSIRVAPSARFHLGYTFLIVFFQLVGGVGAALMIAVDRLVAWSVQVFRRERGETVLSMFFDLGLHILSVVVGALLVSLFLGLPALELSSGVHPILSMLIFSGGFLLAHVTGTSLAVYSRFGFSDLRTRLWPTTVLWKFLSVAAGVPFAIITFKLIGAFDPAWAAIIMLTLVAAVALILKLNAGLMKMNGELKAINRIGNLVTATLSTKELFSIIASESRSVLPWDRFFIALANDENVDLVFVDASGSQTASTRVPRGVGLTGRAMSTGKLVHYEADAAVKDQRAEEFETSTGRRRPKSVVIAPMRFGDEMLGAIAVQSFRPATYGRWQYRILETIAAQAAIAIRNAQLFESEREANRERDEFISLVTHEIKSPLTSISGYVDLARESVSSGDPGGAVESLHVVKAESRKILQLVEDLLDSSKMDAGRFSLDWDEVDLVSLTEQVVELYRGTSRQQIRLRVPERLPMIWGDRLRLGQVVENLVSNACKYSPAGTEIVVTLVPSSDNVQVVVSDRGTGIPPEKLPKIFERFYRVEEGAQVVKGTGLGLYITRQIVQMHGGSIDVESKPGVGTTFTVVLPIRSTSEVDSPSR
jgi:signal transduction histidine kinase